MRGEGFLSLSVIVLAFLGFVLGPLTREWAWATLAYALGFAIQSWRLP